MDKPKRTVTITCPQCGRQRELARAHWKWATRLRRCRACCRTTHGGKGTRLYGIWKSIRTRTGIVSGASEELLARYVGRGITLCADWAASFAAFRDWSIANGYRDDLEIDRIDNDRGYSPDNCRWVNASKNMRNTRVNRLITALGKTQCLVEWVEETGITESCLYARLKRGWDADRAVTTPMDGRFRARRTAK